MLSAPQQRSNMTYLNFRSALLISMPTWCLGSDLSFPVTSYVALGDSFTAAPHSGLPLQDQCPDCQCTASSWAWKLEHDPEIYSTQSDSVFHMAACTGYTSTEIEATVVKNSMFETGAELYTITAGGNDLGFFSIVTSCIYGIIPKNCEGALQVAEDLVTNRSSTFQQNIDSLYKTVQKRTEKTRHRIVVVPYVSFYNHDTQPSKDRPCNLSQDRRRRMNKIVVDLNDLLQSTATENGLEFLPSDTVESRFNGHRLCEPQDRSTSYFRERVWETAARLGCKIPNCGQMRIGLPFHPTDPGNDAYKEALKAYLLGRS